MLVLNIGQTFLDIPHAVGIEHIPHAVGIEHSNLDVHVDTFYWTIRRI